MNNVKLADCVDITLTPISTIKPKGNLYIIKASSIVGGIIDNDSLEKGTLMSNKEPDIHFLKKGDIIFQSKGNKFEATLIDKEYKALVSSQIYFNLKIKKEKLICPVYLCWFLNNRITQNILQSKSSGAVVSSVSRKVLENLIIDIPSNKDQKTITDLINSFSEEKTKNLSYLEKKKLLVNESIIKMIGGEK